jgi:hypothetical protein
MTEDHRDELSGSDAADASPQQGEPEEDQADRPTSSAEYPAPEHAPKGPTHAPPEDAPPRAPVRTTEDPASREDQELFQRFARFERFRAWEEEQRRTSAQGPERTEEQAAEGGTIRGTVVLDHDESPVPDVEIVVMSPEHLEFERRSTTDRRGEYSVGPLRPGIYRVALGQSVVTTDDGRWEAAEPSVRVTVEEEATEPAPNFRLVKQEHLITGRVLRPEGEAASRMTVEVYRWDVESPNKWTPVKILETDEDGTYRYDAPDAGTYRLRFLDEDGNPVDVLDAKVSSRVDVQTVQISPRRRRAAATPPAAGDGGRTDAGFVLSGTNDFPVLTEEVDLARPARPTLTAGGMGGSVGQIVEQNLRDVLGWRPRAGDAKGFLAALDQSFTCVETEGHTECHWTPRSYVVEIQADMGAVTGAQASIFARGKATLDEALPLLAGLEPLIPDYDRENVNSIRAIVRSQLTELVDEFGVEGGPRVARVDQLFGFLLVGRAASGRRFARMARSEFPDAETVEGNLGDLRDQFGLTRDHINTIDEERNFTNFLILVDYVVALAVSWFNGREYFVRGSTEVVPYLGTQLVLLSRDLEVVAESVHEVEYAMDSVFLGPAERQTLELDFDTADPRFTICAGTPTMFLSELLAWVERFASQEGPRLVEDGGKQGLDDFQDTVLLLKCLVAAAQTAPAGVQTNMGDAYEKRRVQRALAELGRQLERAASRVDGIVRAGRATG